MSQTVSIHVQKEEKNEEKQGCRESELDKANMGRPLPPLFHYIPGQKGWWTEKKGLLLSCCPQDMAQSGSWNTGKSD